MKGFQTTSRPNFGSSDNIQADEAGQMTHWHEFAWLGLILGIGLLPRLLFITFFPTTPVSDFSRLLQFAIIFRDDWIAQDAWQWNFFSPGLSLLLAVILKFVDAPPDSVARWATAFLTGLVPVLPYLLWKGVFPPRTRIVAALLLALWPSQILFSSVLALDNWILFPTVAISVLAVRVFVTKEAGSIPVWAALLYAVTTAIRQEMMLVLLPVTILAVVGGEQKNRIRNTLAGTAIIGIIFAGLIVQRGLATGLYTLSTRHVGKAILGAYVPGAGMGWTDPIPYAKVTYPELMKSGDPEVIVSQEGLSLAWHEFLGRPWFHATRILGSVLANLFEMDEHLIWWSLSADGVLPPRYQEEAALLTNNLLPLLPLHRVGIHVLFAASLFFALSQRHLLRWTLPILITIVLKVGLHAVTVSQARYYLVVIALEILVISIVWDFMLKKYNWKLSLRSILLGAVSILILIVAMNYARDYVRNHDIVLRSGDEISEPASTVIPSYGASRNPG